MRAVRVEFVGLLPTFFSTCAPCCSMDYMMACGVDTKTDQLEEYPQDIVETQTRMSQLFVKLIQDYGSLVQPKIVDVTSLRGLWLSLRHGLGRDLAVVVQGKSVLKGNFDYGELKRAVGRELLNLRAQRSTTP